MNIFTGKRATAAALICLSAFLAAFLELTAGSSAASGKNLIFYIEASSRTAAKTDEIADYILNFQNQSSENQIEIKYIFNDEFQKDKYRGIVKTEYRGSRLTRSNLSEIISRLRYKSGTAEGLYTYTSLLKGLIKDGRNSGNKVVAIYSFLCPESENITRDLSYNSQSIKTDLSRLNSMGNFQFHKIKFKRHGLTEVNLADYFKIAAPEPEKKKQKSTDIVEIRPAEKIIKTDNPPNKSKPQKKKKKKKKKSQTPKDDKCTKMNLSLIKSDNMTRYYKINLFNCKNGKYKITSDQIAHTTGWNVSIKFYNITNNIITNENKVIYFHFKGSLKEIIMKQTIKENNTIIESTDYVYEVRN